MKIESIEGISRWLEQSGGLFEALLRELRLVHHGYSVHIEFSVIVDVEGRLLDAPREVGLDLSGVQHFTLEGGLTGSMLEDPDSINWGLSEVAGVHVAPSAEGLQVEVRWEGERRIEIQCRGATLTVPGERTSP